MGELLEVYSLDGEFLQVQDRDQYYKEIREEFRNTGTVSRKVKSIRLLLLNSQGRIYIQRRSYEKGENPGLCDKTIGGHVKAGYTWELTVVQECHQELGVPAVVLSDDQFSMASKATDLKIIGVFRKIETINTFISVRRATSGDFRQPYITSFYIGYYDGSIRFCDGESMGIEVISLDALESRVKQFPADYTEDLKFMLKRYRNYLVPVKKDENVVLGYDEADGVNLESQDIHGSARPKAANEGW